MAAATDDLEPPASRGWFHLATLLVVGIVCWHVTATYTVLSHTVDEPTHIAAGMEWLESGTHRLHSENPPLSRVPLGLGPHLAGLRLPPEGLSFRRGTDVLYSGESYQRNLVLTRVGALPFFLLAILLVWLWTRKLGGGRAAFVAVASFCTVPPVMGHAGLASTDIAFVATFSLALYTCVRWLESPTRRRAVGFGLGVGLALATKFSTLVFFPPCFVALLVVRLLFGKDGVGAGPWPSRRQWLAMAVTVGALSLVVVWGAYRFTVGRLDAIPEAASAIQWAFPDAASLGRRCAQWLSHWPVPAPDGVIGLFWIYAHSTQGNTAYMLGEQSARGFWYFYPVALAVKTPLTFCALTLASGVALLRLRCGVGWVSLAPAAAAVAIVLSLIPTTINIGLRHVLVVYPLFAITVGLGVEALLRRAVGVRRQLVTAALALLLNWQALLVFLVYPNYIAYFNPLAGREPGRVMVDSDLDWGQDLLQLAEFFEGRDVDQLHIAYFGSVHLCEHGLPPLRWLQPGEQVKGWIAVSEMYYRDLQHNTFADACDRRRAIQSTVRGGYAWLHQHEPVAWAGRSIRIYHLP